MSSWDSPRFTCDYSQPESYRFSLDSILLAKAVARDLAESPLPADARVLDLCAGSGVVGLELGFLRREVKNIAFLEIQPDYHSHFILNQQRSAELRLQSQWLELNYKELKDPQFKNLYDLIVCNPPYFEKNQGLIPPDPLKARSRFLLDASFEDLWHAILNTLKPAAKAYVLIREQTDHGSTRKSQIQALLQTTAQILKIEDLRGTDLYCVQKMK